MNCVNSGGVFLSYEIENDIKKIISRVCKSDDEERQMFEDIFSELAKHQEKFLCELEKRIIEEKNSCDWDKDFDIAVKIASGDYEKVLRDFFPVNVGCSLIFCKNPSTSFETTAESDFQETAFFVEADYKAIDNFCFPRKYQGQIITADGTEKKFFYSLQRHDRFVRQEKILFEISELYKIERPVIFSPYARKAVDIKIFDCNADDFKNLQKVDWQLEKNNLRGILLTDLKLFWNVKIESDSIRRGRELGEKEEYIGADGNLIRYEYFQTFDRDKKIFVLPEQHCDDLRIISDDERKFILGYHSVLSEKNCKIISLNDIEKVLNCFNSTRRGKVFPAHFESFNAKNFTPLERYRREDNYYISTKNFLLLSIRNKPVCLINFGGARNIFKVDYANYVLNYFELNYPEFNWAGVEA